MIFEQACEICGTKVVFDHEQLGYQYPCKTCRILVHLGTNEQWHLAEREGRKARLLGLFWVLTFIFSAWAVLLCFVRFEQSLVWLVLGVCVLCWPIARFNRFGVPLREMYDFRMKLSLTCLACGARTAQRYWITPKETTCPVCHETFLTPWGMRS